VDDPRPTSHRFVSQRLNLQYLDWGNAGAPLLLLVHGARDHAHNWDWVARRLSGNWHVICPDLRGHGDSDWSPDGNYSIPVYVADLCALIDHVGDRPVSLVGHSLGGAIALHYTGVFPGDVRRLAVIDGLGLSSTGRKSRKPMTTIWRDWISARRSIDNRVPRRYAHLEQAFARMAEQNPHLSREQVEHLTIHGIRENDDGTFGWKFDNHTRSALPMEMTDGKLVDLLHGIDCPVWLVHGADSWTSHPEDVGLAAHFKCATITSYEGAGHWVQHDRLEGFVTDLARFLSIR